MEKPLLTEDTQTTPGGLEIQKTENTKNSKDYFIPLMCMMAFIVNVGDLCLAPVFPDLAQTQFNLDLPLIGTIYISFYFGKLFFTPIVGQTMLQFGRRNYICMGFVILTFSMFGFGSLPFLTSKRLFIIISISSRVVQGIGKACVQPAVYAIIGILYPKRQEEIIGYVEGSVAFGSQMGPVVGSVLYMIGGFSTVFYTLGSFYLICIFMVHKIVKKEADKQTSTGDQSEEENQEILKQITYWTVMKNHRVCLGFFASVFSIMQVAFLEPIISLRMKQFGYDAEDAGYLFLCQSIPFVIGCATVSRSLGKSPRQTVIMFAFICVTATTTLFGPSEFLNYPNEFWLIVVGYALSGYTLAFAFVPSCPEMLNAAETKLGMAHPKINDIISSLFSLGCALGGLIGPQLSTIYMSQYGYRKTCDLFTLLSLSFTVVYILVTVGSKRPGKKQT